MQIERAQILFSLPTQQCRISLSIGSCCGTDPCQHGGRRPMVAGHPAINTIFPIRHPHPPDHIPTNAHPLDQHSCRSPNSRSSNSLTASNLRANNQINEMQISRINLITANLSIHHNQAKTVILAPHPTTSRSDTWLSTTSSLRSPNSAGTSVCPTCASRVPTPTATPG